MADHRKHDLLMHFTFSNVVLKWHISHAEVGNNSPDIAPHTGAPAITVPMSFTSAGVLAGLLYFRQLLSLPSVDIGAAVCALNMRSADDCLALASANGAPKDDGCPCVAGMPLGLQFLARPWDEATLIRIAYAYEQATQHRRPPLDFPECAATVNSQVGAQDQSSADLAEITSG